MGVSDGEQNSITRIQTLAQTDLAEVPPEFIQHPLNRPTIPPPIPTPSTTIHENHPLLSSLPLIDLTTLPFCSLLSDIARASSEWGAFQVFNHGVPIHLLESMSSATASFFNDFPNKSMYARDPNSTASEGYGSQMLNNESGIVLDWRSYFDHHTLPLSRRVPSRWPDFPPNYRQLMAEYSDHMNALALRIMELVSESLGLPCHYIESALGSELCQNITVSYYPPCPQPELTLGLQAHSDFGAITLLRQDDIGGLQVSRNGEWILVQPFSEAVVVILGDQTEIMSNGEYKSAVHRAITNRKRARLSISAFHDPAKTIRICPAPELVSKHSGARYGPIVYGEYVSSWYMKGPQGKENLDGLRIL